MLSLATLANVTTVAAPGQGRGAAVRATGRVGFPAEVVSGVAATLAGKIGSGEADADEGQIAAGDGNAVPDAAVPDLTLADPMAWLATMMIPAAPVQAPAAPAVAAGGSQAAAPATTVAAPGLPQLATPMVAATPVARGNGPAPTAIPADAPVQALSGQPAPVTGLPFATDPALATANGPIVIDVADRPVPALPVATASADDPAPPPKPATPLTAAATALVNPATPAALQPGTAAPAAQVFAAAIHASAQDEDRDRKPAAVDAAATPTLAVAALDTGHHAVAATGDTAAQPSLDMRQERWPHAMVDHIERLRDDANAADTRIRLVPDALGGIDVAVRRDGDTLHVHFTAEQPATRTMLADAQPRLAEIAEARGLRLGQTGVSTGTGGGSSPQQQTAMQQQAGQQMGQQQAGQHQARQHAAGQGRGVAAAASPSAPAADDALSTDTRVA